jgi:hypothetical protein
MSASTVGLMGVVITRIRGGAQPGEIRVIHNGLTHTYIAYADSPLAVGAQVLVINARGGRQVDVEPWDLPGPDTAGVPHHEEKP